MTNHWCIAMTLKSKPNYPNGVKWHCAAWILVTRSYSQRGYYLEVIRRLRKAIRQKRTELWKNQSWIFHHDNARAHTSMLVWTVIISQPPYSPSLAPTDLFFFPKLKTPIKGKRFATIEEIKAKSKQEPLAITKSSFQKCFEDSQA